MCLSVKEILCAYPIACVGQKLVKIEFVKNHWENFKLKKFILSLIHDFQKPLLSRVFKLKNRGQNQHHMAVSYTHLTLPTIYSV